LTLKILREAVRKKIFMNSFGAEFFILVTITDLTLLNRIVNPKKFLDSWCALNKKPHPHLWISEAKLPKFFMTYVLCTLGRLGINFLNFET
jgi:hypothetical protein